MKWIKSRKETQKMKDDKVGTLLEILGYILGAAIGILIIKLTGIQVVG